ncbi:hypothetical protein SCA6_010466 [Theobroma cacao]
MYLYLASPPSTIPTPNTFKCSISFFLLFFSLFSLVSLFVSKCEHTLKKVSQAETMKQSFLSGALLLFFLILISSSHLSARLIANKQGKFLDRYPCPLSFFTNLETKVQQISFAGKEDVELSKITDREDIELINQLMGVEACDTGDDECLKRRIVSEAHLDYIYTQHHKP